MLLMVIFCNTQTKKPADQKIDRSPAVAGSFYSADKARLLHTVEQCFAKSEKYIAGNPLAVIVPHAGYVFSGEVAAASYKQIDREKSFDHIFILGSSHTMYFEGAATYTMGDFLTPIGKVPVDPLAISLTEKYDFIRGDSRPHIREHSLEVQLPFLQYWLLKPFTILPIIIGGESRKTSALLADALRPYFNEDNLFVISTDFSHYPNYSSAIISDNSMAEAIQSNTQEMFLQTKKKMEDKGIPNLATAICGWTSVLTLLNLTEGKPVEYKKILYRNSGDSNFGDRDRVVGYYAICAITDERKNGLRIFELNRDDKIQLLSIARKTLEKYLSKNTIPKIDKNDISPNNLEQTGAFVTIFKNGELRGCIGHIRSEQPLYKSIQSLVVSSALRDYRFNPVTESELKDIEIEISVLTPMKRITSIDDIEMGRHGVYLRKGSQTGTFLPQVAEETNWTKEEFLGRCSRDKAHIGWEGWKEAEIYTYEALKFSESDFRGDVKRMIDGARL